MGRAQERRRCRCSGGIGALVAALGAREDPYPEEPAEDELEAPNWLEADAPSGGPSFPEVPAAFGRVELLEDCACGAMA